MTLPQIRDLWGALHEWVVHNTYGGTLKKATVWK